MTIEECELRLEAGNESAVEEARRLIIADALKDAPLFAKNSSMNLEQAETMQIAKAAVFFLFWRAGITEIKTGPDGRLMYSKGSGSRVTPIGMVN